MKNIFLEEMSDDEILLEELLKDEVLLKKYLDSKNGDAIEYYKRALECDLELIEEEGSKKK